MSWKKLLVLYNKIEFILENALHFRAYSNKNSNFNPQNIGVPKVMKVEPLHSETVNS